ncbi:YL1 nuclear protein-domain-containing protein [Daedaleopsis nitida]|nr:YL1 nuclear protein-domain-containing protein [Daedaleopsis nitida]
MEDSLVSRRPKRATAGNRMEAALAEFKAEDLGMDVEEDADFTVDKEEDDIFGSDFESTDEEGAQEEVDAAAENFIRQEESRVRKTARTQLERVTALAHAQQAATFNPTTIAPPDPEKQKAGKKIKRRVSLGFAVNVETGEVLDEVMDAGDATETAGRRHSTRTHTVANTSATVNRVKDEVRKQSSTPKRVKTKIKAPTQAELIARALDMEEGNIDEHKNYLTLEEEKRKKARVVRASVQGPLVRWVSKKEEITVISSPAQYSHTNASNSAQSPIASTPANPSPPPFQQWPPPPIPPAYAQNAPPSWTPTTPVNALPPPPVITPTVTPAPAPALPSNPVPPPPSRPIERKETVAKQYVVHELEQTEKPSRPNWASTMTAMFGNHVDWESSRVYTTKGRPFARPTRTCPITGRVAKYLDPRTNVPYADLGAYRVLSAVFRHEYVWSPDLGCYVSREGSVFAQEGT